MLTILLPLVTTPYLSRVLGSENIGIYGYTISIVTYFILFGTLGVSVYGQREIAYVQDNKKSRSKLFWEIIITRCITLAISSFIFILVYSFRGNYVVYYRILLIQLVANLFDIAWLFYGLEEFDKAVVRNLVIKLIGLILIFVTVKTQNDLWKYFLILAASEFIGNILLWVYVPKYICKIKIHDIQLKKHIRSIIILFVPQVAIQIYTVLDKTMIGGITGDMAVVGFYEQAQKIMRAALLVVTSLGTVVSSRVSNIYVSKNKEGIKSYLEKSFTFVWALSLPMILGIIAVSPQFVPIFYGAGYEQVIPLLSLMSVLICVIGLSNVTGMQYLIPTKKQKAYTISVFFGCIVNMLMNFVLIKLYGAVGAVISSIIAEIVVLAVQLFYVRETIGVRIVFNGCLKYLLGAIVMFVVVKATTMFIESNVVKMIAGIIMGTFAYFITMILMKDKFILDAINQLRGKVKLIINGKFGKS